MPPSFRRFAASLTKLTDWGTTHEADLNDFLGQQGRLHKEIIANNRFLLMGWAPSSVGDVYHDGFLPDLGWELLT